MFTLKRFAITMGGGAIALLTLSTAQAAADTTVQKAGGVPLNVAKRLDRTPQATTTPTPVALSGVPMRIATRLTGVDEFKTQQLTMRLSPSLTGIAMERAKRT